MDKDELILYILYGSEIGSKAVGTTPRQPDFSGTAGATVARLTPAHLRGDQKVIRYVNHCILLQTNQMLTALGLVQIG